MMRQLNENQLKYLADVFNNMGMMFFISLVVPVFSKNFQNIDSQQVALGAVYSIVAWFLGFIILIRKDKNDQH